MAVDPSEISLSPEQKRALARVAENLGVAWSEAFDLVVQHGRHVDLGWMLAQQKSLSRVWNNDEDSIYDGL